jgi:hypothetical protein
MIFYIIDTTINPMKEVRFNDYPSTVRYLEGMTQRAYKQNRKERMNMLEEIGHGYDDRDSITFVRSMASQFEMGVIRNNAGVLNRMKCDITAVALYQKSEFGD